MFAVIKTGGKQYKVAAEDEIVIMNLPGEAGDAVTFDEVLSIGDAEALDIGTPLIEGATVAAEIVKQARGPKVIAFKKRRRQNSRRKRGHRQDLTIVRITEILNVGQAPGSHRRASAEAERAAPVEAGPAETAAEAVPA